MNASVVPEAEPGADAGATSSASGLAGFVAYGRSDRFAQTGEDEEVALRLCNEQSAGRASRVRRRRVPAGIALEATGRRINMAEQDCSSYGTIRLSYGGLKDTGIHWQEASPEGVTVVRLRPLSVSTLRSFG